MPTAPTSSDGQSNMPWVSWVLMRRRSVGSWKAFEAMGVLGSGVSLRPEACGLCLRIGHLDYSSFKGSIWPFSITWLTLLPLLSCVCFVHTQMTSFYSNPNRLVSYSLCCCSSIEAFGFISQLHGFNTVRPTQDSHNISLQWCFC